MKRPVADRAFFVGPYWNDSRYAMMRNLFTYWTRQLFKPGALIQEQYTAFQSLLEADKRAHERMAELEEILYDQVPVDFCAIEKKYGQFSDAVGRMITDLARICPAKYASLGTYHKKFDDYVRSLLGVGKAPADPPYVLNLYEPQAKDPLLVGGKTANLARVAQSLKLPVPAGFAVTTRAFHRFMASNDLNGLIADTLAHLDIHSGESLDAASEQICHAIHRAAVPPEVVEAVNGAIDNAQAQCRHTRRFAVRSSARGEDTRTSFAGQYLTVLNIDADEILAAYRQVLASKYLPAALVYRINYGLTDRETPMAVLVVEMIDAQASGVMYTGQSDGHAGDPLAIHAVWGLGQPLVDGVTVPAVFQIAKTDPPVLVSRIPHGQADQRVLDPEQGLVSRPLDEKQAAGTPLSTTAALELARWGSTLESHLNGPQDVEWCLNRDERLVLLQTRPFHTETGLAASDGPLTCTFETVENEILVSGGIAAAGGVASGRTVHIGSLEDLARMPDGSVAITRSIPPEFAAAVNRLHAVVAAGGSFAGHFASVAREFGIPTIVNAVEALTAIPDGTTVTVNAENTTVYRGHVPSMVASPCARRNLLADSPFMQRLGAVMSFISALELVNPGKDNFTPEGCRSHHDIIRFVHEKAVSAMFQLSNIRFRKVGGSRKLRIGIPMLFYAIDVGGGLNVAAGGRSEVGLEHVESAPLRALFNGLTHPDIQWGTFSHFDWASHDKVVMSGGYINPDSVMFASHAIISATYANLNLRFGYHFVVLDAVCSAKKAENYILLRFSGGGADMEKRRLRALFLSRIFQRLGFDVTRKSDLIDARYGQGRQEEVARTLDLVGRLLGATRLMDMYLKNESMADAYVDEFMQGRYHFSNVEL